jgi:hypothetical protein
MSILETPFYVQNKSANPEITDSRVWISENPRFIYFRIPKAANSTIMATLFYAQFGKTANHKRLELFKRQTRRIRTFTQTEVDLLHLTYFTFSVVRNPYTRIASCYLEKMKRDSSERKKVATSINRAGPDIAIEDFVDYLSCPDGLYADAHWMPQTDLIPIGAQNLDKLLRFESFTSELPILLTQLYDKSVTIKNHIPMATRGSELAKHVMSRDLRKKVYDIYKEDFEVLKYKYESE